MKYLKRDIETKLLEASKSFACITLYGPRQVGKSTLLNNLFKGIRTVSLDDIEIRDFAIKDPKGFITYFKQPLIIDEIQKAPQLLDYIKIVIDNKKAEWLANDTENELLYILSGSNQYELAKSISDSLAGRTITFNLLSLSYNEIKQRESNNYFDTDINKIIDKSKKVISYRSRKEIFESIFIGGMPEYLTKKYDRDMFFKSYISTYIEKDVKRVIAADKELTFMNFMKYLSLRTACQIDYTEIARSVGIDSRTVKGWISILETSGIIKILQPYCPNVSNRITRSGKIYFMDTGLCCYLCGMPSAEILERSAFAGPFYETYVVSEIVKSYLNHYKDIRDIYYYRDKDQREVDMIIDMFDSLTPIEIKKGINPVNHNKKFNVLKIYGKSINIGLVIDSRDSILPINDEVYYCPIDLIGL